jgi:hypothetical protein
MLRMKFTSEPIKAGNCESILPEFGRTEDVARLFGIKRGSLYNLWKQREVRSVLWRIEGSKSGLRLWYLPGIRAKLIAMMEQQVENETAEPVESPEQDDSFHE